MKSKKFKELLAANPENELFRFSLGQSFMDEGNPNKAIPLFEKCQRKKPDWMMASILKAKCHMALERMEEARLELIEPSNSQLSKSMRHRRQKLESFLP